MFGQDSKIQLAVLQERFKAHEQIVERVDSAIQTLSETNQNICKMLAVHDERITTQAKSDDEICKKVDDIEVKVDELSKFKWVTAGVISIALLFVPVVTDFISSSINSFSEPVKTK